MSSATGRSATFVRLVLCPESAHADPGRLCRNALGPERPQTEFETYYPRDERRPTTSYGVISYGATCLGRGKDVQGTENFAHKQMQCDTGDGTVDDEGAT